MILDFTVGRLVNLAGALAVAALGAALLVVRPRSRTNAAFGVFAVAWASGFLGGNLLPVDHPLDFAGQVWDGVSFLVAAVPLGVAASDFRRPLARVERGLWVPVGVVVASGLVLAVIVLLQSDPAVVPDVRAAPQVFGHGVMWGVAVLWALRAARPEVTPDERRQYAVLSTALVLYPTGFVAFLVSRDPLLLTAAVWTLAVAVVLAACWLRAGARGADPRLARSAALWPLGVAFANLAIAAVFGAGVIFDSPLPGMLRFATVAVLVYAVLRHQLLGIDVKVRWGLSKSTVAAVFIAVFFVTSEAAQQFLGATLGSAYVGIAAAGLLVFAIAPLQRAAERLAEKAVPVAGVVGTPTGGSAVALYRAQVELAWTDGRISPNERVMLRGLRKQLGLDAEVADAVEHEVETGRLRGADPPPAQEP